MKKISLIIAFCIFGTIAKAQVDPIIGNWEYVITKKMVFDSIIYNAKMAGFDIPKEIEPQTRDLLMISFIMRVEHTKITFGENNTILIEVSNPYNGDLDYVWGKWCFESKRYEVIYENNNTVEYYEMIDGELFLCTPLIQSSKLAKLFAPHLKLIRK
jgi:hypothetical protein